jgi:hypothetical protein
MNRFSSCAPVNAMWSLLLLLGAPAAMAGDLCSLVGTGKLDEMLPAGAPWIRFGAHEPIPRIDVPGVDMCHFSTDPHASGNEFIEPNAARLAIKRIVMGSAADAETKLKNELQAWRKGTIFDVYPTPGLGSDAFRYQPKSTAPNAKGGAVFFTGRRANVIIEESLYLPSGISPREQTAAAQLLTTILKAPEAK